MAGADHRAADADDRAGGGAGGQPYPDRDGTAVFGRFVGDLSLLAQCPDESETAGPSLEEPWDAQAADELARLYASGEAGLARPLSGDAELQLRLARTTAQAAALNPPAGTDGEGIEARLGALAAAIEAALARMDAQNPRTDTGGLKILEAHTGEILAQAQEARIELGRLAAIEAQLDELKSSVSDGKIAGLIQAVMPTEDELTRLAEMAVREAVRERPEAAGDLSAAARLTERASEIQRSLARFIDEQRHSEGQVAEALETMQQAMQYILERIDAIEGALAISGEVLSEVQEHPGGTGERMAQASAVGSVEDARMRAGLAATGIAKPMAMPGEEDAEPGSGVPMRDSPAWEDLTFGDHRFDAEAMPADASGDDDAVTARARLAAERAAYADDMRPLPTPGQRGARATSARAGGRSPLRPGILLAASLGAFLLAGYWLASGPMLPLPDSVDPQTAEQHHPVTTLPAAAPALRSFSAGSDPDGALETHAGAHSMADAPGQAIEHGSQASRIDGGDEPEAQAQRTEGDTADAPVDLGRWTAPVGTDELQGPIGVVIEQGHTAMSPEDLLRLRQRQRMANLSTRLGQQAAAPAAHPIALSTDGTTAESEAAPPAGETQRARVSVELPPIMIGPHSLRHAAANGDASAQFEVAARFAEGKGVKRDFAQAAVWYQRAATQGFAAAQYRLAALYERGIGITTDKARAKTWYQRAAEQGNLKAMHNLAVLSARDGEGTAPDYVTAARWFGEAAAHGLADSQYNFGILHESGQGVVKDTAAAYKWYALAARSGDKEAMRRRDLAKERLSPAALAAVEAEIAAWQGLPADRLANDAGVAGQAWKRRAAESAD